MTKINSFHDLIPVSRSSGLFGILGPYDPQELEVMGSLLAHRGQGVDIQYISPTLAIGCIGGERSAGHFRSVCSGNVQVCNRRSGSIQEEGAFSSAALRGILERANDPQQRELTVTGDYAMVWLDDTDGSLVLARDQFGRQPLYWSKSCERIAFSSEYKAILSVSGMTFKPDLGVIMSFQEKGFVVPERCFVETVHPVPCGGLLKILNPTVVPVEISVTPQRPEQLTRGVGAEADELIATLENSIANTLLQTAVDEPFAIALSSGVDSSLLVGLSRRLFPKREIHTFTVGYSSKDPEIVGASETAREFQTTHHEVIVSPTDLAGSLEDAIWHMEDPIGHDEYPCLYLLAEAISRCPPIRTVLIGNGSDGLFAGMPLHRKIEEAHHLPELRSSLEKEWNSVDHDKSLASLRSQHVSSTNSRGTLAPPPFLVRGCKGFAPQPALVVDWNHDPVGDVLWHTIVNYDGRLAGQTNLFAAFGLLAQMPYLDTNLVEFALSLPGSRRFGPDGLNKLALREAAKAVLPDEIRLRPKGIQHLKRDTVFADVLDDLRVRFLQGSSGPQFFSKDDLATVSSWRTSDGYVGARFERLWNILVAETWARLFM